MAMLHLENHPLCIVLFKRKTTKIYTKKIHQCDDNTHNNKVASLLGKCSLQVMPSTFYNILYVYTEHNNLSVQLLVKKRIRDYFYKVNKNLLYYFEEVWYKKRHEYDYRN